MKKIILLAELDEPRRHTISILLESCGYPVMVAASGEEALRLALDFQGPIDLLLADIELPGTELAKQLNSQRPGMKTLFLSGSKSGIFVLSEGWQFLPMPFVWDMLRTTIRAIVGASEAGPNDGLGDAAGLGVLTRRENQVLKLIAAGHSTKQIASILGITFKTADGHRCRLMKKLDIHDSPTLVRYAIRAGVIQA